MLQNKWRLISLALIGVIGILAGAVYAASHGGTEVRILGLRHDDGRVEVALEQINEDGSRGEVIRPEQRIIPADVTDRWLRSSPVTVQVVHAHDDGMMEDPMPEAAMPSDEGTADLYCIVHHGADTDPFWIGFNGFAHAGAAGLGLANVEVHSEPIVADQAAAVADCVDRGAVGIASTIPDLDGLRDALTGARASGAVLITFNSGAEVAGQVGSTVHYGLDDAAAGRLAGQEFNNAGATGLVLCVIHEEVNIGLSDRCDGLEDTYGGSVVRVTLPAGSLTDPVAAGTALAGGIMANRAAGVLVLNGALAQVATGTVAAIDSDAIVGVNGASVAAPFLVNSGDLLFAINDGGQVQATHVTLALKNVDANPGARALLALSASQAQGTTMMLMRPLVLNQDYISNLPADWEAQACALAAQHAPQLASAFCDQ